MKIRYRNEHRQVFTGKQTVEKVIAFAIAAEEHHGWSLDVSRYNSGLSITDEAITLHLVKISDNQETLDGETLMLDYAFNNTLKSFNKERNLKD